MPNDILDDINYPHSNLHIKHLRHIWKFVLGAIVCGSISISIMLTTLNAREFSEIVGCSENTAFVGVFSLLGIAVICIIITIYKLIRYFVAKSHNNS